MIYSYSSAIFNRTLETIEDHKAKHLQGEADRRVAQALDWWDCLPELARENLMIHSFNDKQPKLNNIVNFYWGE